MDRPHPPSTPVYDTIGVGYGGVRRSDPRIAERLHAALGAARRVLNVGAGTGSYEPTDRTVVAVEPSMAMIAQRPAGPVGSVSPGGSAPTVRAVADALPFAPDSFEAAMALLTVHHWPDPAAGLDEVRRVTTGPVVVFTFDARVHERQWLVTDYLPAIADLDTHLPTPEAIAAALGGGVVEVLPIPHDCTDGFLHAYWRRPERYLDPGARAGISGIARRPAQEVDQAMARLRADLDDGSWARRHRDLLDRDTLDAGYRIVVATS